MSKQVICANNRITGCEAIITQKGNVLCDTCMELKKRKNNNNDMTSITERMLKLENNELELKLIISNITTEKMELEKKNENLEKKIIELQEQIIDNDLLIKKLKDDNIKLMENKFLI